MNDSPSTPETFTCVNHASRLGSVVLTLIPAAITTYAAVKGSALVAAGFALATLGLIYVAMDRWTTTVTIDAERLSMRSRWSTQTWKWAEMSEIRLFGPSPNSQSSLQPRLRSGRVGRSIYFLRWGQARGLATSLFRQIDAHGIAMDPSERDSLRRHL